MQESWRGAGRGRIGRLPMCQLQENMVLMLPGDRLRALCEFDCQGPRFYHSRFIYVAYLVCVVRWCSPLFEELMRFHNRPRSYPRISRPSSWSSYSNKLCVFTLGNRRLIGNAQLSDDGPSSGTVEPRFRVASLHHTERFHENLTVK